MPDDNSLRYLFGEPQPAGAIDVDEVLRRSRARRAPRVLGAAGVSLLAIGGIVLGGLQLGGAPSPASDAAGGSLEGMPAADSSADELFSEAIKRAPAEKLNLCAGPVAEVDSSATGLTLSVSFGDAPAGSSRVDGTVTLTNTGAEFVSGYTATSPAITLARDGIVIWHSNGAVDYSQQIDLAPGESMDYAASFTPVVCGVDDDSAESFRADLPAAPAGQYAVSAAIDVMGDADAELVVSPASTIILR